MLSEPQEGGEVNDFPQKRSSCAPFKERAIAAIEAGYSPIPRRHAPRPGKGPSDAKAPAIKGWQGFCDRQMTAEEIAQTFRAFPLAHISLAVGYASSVRDNIRVLWIDIDTDDTEFIAAVHTVIPPSPVSRRGSKGRADAYRVVVNDGESLTDWLKAKGVKRAHFPRGAGGKKGRAPLLELPLNITIPPSIHPETGRPYEWLGDSTVYDTTPDDLPEITADQLGPLLEHAISRWTYKEPAADPSPRRATTTADIREDERAAYQRMADKAADKHIPAVRSMRGKGGRGRALYSAACALGMWVKHGFLDQHRVEADLFDASAENGLVAENGKDDVRRTIANGFDKAAADQLPELKERPLLRARPASSDAAIQINPGCGDKTSFFPAEERDASAPDQPDTQPDLSAKDLPALVVHLAAMPDVEWLPQAASLCEGRGVTKAELKRLVKDSRKEAALLARVKAREDNQQARKRRWETLEELPLSRNDPNTSADLFKQEHHPHLVYLQQEFLSWDGAAYVVVDPEYLKTQVRGFLRTATAEDEYGNLAPFCPKADDVSQVIAALADGSGLDSANVKTPSWLRYRGVNPLCVISFRNGWLDTMTGAFNAPDSDLLTRNALAFRYDPTAPRPKRFHEFLQEVWPSEEEQKEFIPQLQRVMGLLLIPDTSFQKIFLFLGIPRSGKGTLLRLINQLVGEVNSGATSARSLAKGEFTLDSFRGKTLVSIPDMRVNRDLADDLTEKLLNISGEDKVSINRKNKSILNETLTCRLLIASNDVPSFPDDSGALSKRYIPFRFKTTFEGKEDGELGGKLESELPGIANWALVGLTAIRKERRFFLGPLAKAELKIAYAQGAPLAEFAEDRIDIKAGASIIKDQLYSAYTLWCVGAGTAKPLGQAIFHKKLRSMIPSISEGRPRDDDNKPIRTIYGISLLP